MRIARLLRLIFAALIAGGGLCLAGPAAFAQGRVALVLGNSAYAHGGRLANPPNDAAAVATSLRQVGFEVFTQGDLGKVQLEAALKSFTRAAAGADIAVVYYAGHGIEKGGTNYLIPVDATLAADSDIDFEAVPLDLVMHAVAGASRLKVVILDACRNNPFRDTMRRSSGTRGIGQGLAKPPDPEEGDMLVAYAAEAGSTAEDGTGGNSPFAAALARHLPDPDVDIRIMFGRIRDDVRTATQRRQEPAVYESLGGEQFFMKTAVPAGGAILTAGPPAFAPAPDARALDLAFWQSVQASDDRAQLQAYLDQYPKGTFAAAARAKIAALDATPPPAPPLQRARRPLVSAASEGRAAEVAPAGSAAAGFDGRWDVVQTCPRSTDGAAPFVNGLSAVVVRGQLHAERGTPGQPGWVTLDGMIGPDGEANLQARGLTGPQIYSINHTPPGQPYRHPVTAHFGPERGAGRWLAQRVCEFTFTRR